MVHGAYHAANRALVLVVAVVSKLIFITLVLSFGRQYLGQQVVLALVGDGVMIGLFVGYLLAMRTRPKLA